MKKASQRAPHENCGKKNRQGKPCGMLAGWGTTHNGDGACKFHGGATPIKHGLYSKYKGKLVADRVEELVDDPELLDMRRPIAVLEALTQRLLEALEPTDTVGIIGQDVRMALLQLAKEQAKAIERYHKITEGTKYTIRIEHIQAVVYQIVQVADETISDPADRRRFVERLGQLTLPGPPSAN
jgi:hypothetical protein